MVHSQIQRNCVGGLDVFAQHPDAADRVAEELDRVLGDHAVSAGTTIFYPIWAVHMSAEYWPEPKLFNPARFAATETAKRPEFAYIPFGLGPRSCEGASLAMVEAELMLAVLVRRFRLELAADHEVIPIERFVLWAADDIRMNLTSRDQRCK